ncbi:MAG: TonB-dependent receptor [Gemmatimonadales bacterium]
MGAPGCARSVGFIVLVVCTAQVAPAQVATDEATAAATITGGITDAASGKPVSQAQVVLRESELRASTDLSGRFSLRKVKPGTYTLEVRRIGYEPVVRGDVSVARAERLRLDITMRPAAFQLSEVTVTPGSFSFLDAVPAVRQTMSRAEIQAAPFGEDLFRALSRLPGLSSGDYAAHFSIRGGRHDETLILFDGLEIYEPFHLKDFAEGALSIIDVEAIDGVELLTGGFPAHYGDKTSGVMSISSRTPKEDGIHVTAGASLTNANVLAEGAFASRNGSWLVSGRRGFVDQLLSIINKKETKAPTYEDVFATIRYKIHPNHTLALSALHAGDKYRFSISGTTGFNDSIKTEEAANNGYGNSYAWATLRSIFGEYLRVKTLASVGSVTATREGDEHHLLRPIELYAVKGKRSFSVVGLKQDFSWQRSGKLLLDWGYDLRSMSASFNWENRVTQNPDDPTPDTLGFYPKITRRTKKTDGRTIGAYVSNRIQLFDPLALEAGIRYDGATYTHDSDWSPRIHALIRLSQKTSLRTGWGYYRQRQGIADENAFDTLNRYFPSELSKQWTVGLEHRYAVGGSLRAEAYYKRGSNLRPVLRNWKSGLNVFPESSEDRILVYPEESWSKGFEVYHDRKLGNRMTVRGGYAMAFTEERVSRIVQVNDPLKPPFDSTHPGPQDQRHALNLDLSYRPFSNWSLTTAYTFHSGWPFTDEKGVVVKKRNGTTDLAVRPDSLYAGRLPAYHRVDLRLTRRRRSPNGELRFFVEVINLTNHENVLGYDVFRVSDPVTGLRLARDPETWFSILPSAGVSWSRKF